jgi:hypothetical protein
MSKRFIGDSLHRNIVFGPTYASILRDQHFATGILNAISE